MLARTDFRAELILVCNSLDAGGIERVVSTLANEWSRRGRKVSVVTLHDRQRFYSLDPPVHHVIVERLGNVWISTLLRTARSCLLQLRRLQPTLLAILGPTLYHLLSEGVYRAHFRTYLAFETLGLRRALGRIDSPLVVSFGTSVNVITLKACRGMNRRVIVSERNDPRRLIQLWAKLWQECYPQADKVTANTLAGLRDLGQFVRPEKLALVPNPLHLPNGNDHGTGAATQSSPAILTVGQMVHDKAHDVLLDAFARAGDSVKDWRLVIVGEGRLQTVLRKQAEHLGLSARVDWLGVVRDIEGVYRTAVVFALPSRVEGTPNALLEAMSFGLPVVVSDGAPGLLEIVEHEVTGLVVPVDNPAELAAALSRLASDAELRRRLGAAARERVREYDLPRALATWESVIGLGPEHTA
jgi:glycosyltransferase involved in cell wall biosynthesis